MSTSLAVDQSYSGSCMYIYSRSSQYGCNVDHAVVQAKGCYTTFILQSCEGLAVQSKELFVLAEQYKVRSCLC